MFFLSVKVLPSQIFEKNNHNWLKSKCQHFIHKKIFACQKHVSHESVCLNLKGAKIDMLTCWDLSFEWTVLLSLPGWSAFFLCQFFGSLIQNFVFQWRITMSLFFFWFLQEMSTNFRNQINKCFHKNTLYWTMGNQLSNEFCNEIYCYINVLR